MIEIKCDSVSLILKTQSCKFMVRIHRVYSEIIERIINPELYDWHSIQRRYKGSIQRNPVLSKTLNLTRNILHALKALEDLSRIHHDKTEIRSDFVGQTFPRMIITNAVSFGVIDTTHVTRTDY